ncbi:solute carrier organic anion transporter family member 4A1-like [Apostichopus japonicus]|uniref:solute carrier organic anion transporter family member 4A1-like n=1 Tax=Stichopus japonicus TaxID=307972 RepID=UPI003AB75EC5
MASGQVNLGYDRQDSQMQLTQSEMKMASESGHGSVTSAPITERMDSMEKKEYDEVFLPSKRDPESCGWCALRPRCFQKLNNPIMFMIFLCAFAMAQSATISGLVLVNITTLERRFNLPSTRTGTISSCFDFVVMAVIVFVTYGGEKGNKPVFIGTGAAIFGLGSFLFTLPHFLSGLYQYGGNVEDNFCGLNRTADLSCDGSDDSTVESLSQYFWVFVAAQVLHGLGAAPLYALGQTFLYENIKPESSSLYIGVFQAAATFSPAIGFLGGGILLDNMYTDLSVEEYGIDNTSPLWVGNWWLGFLIIGVISLLTSLPLIAYPKYLRGAKRFKHQRKPSTQKGSEFVPSAGFGGSLKDFPRAILTLLKNMPFLLINLAVGSESFIIACVSVFGPKYVESQFNVTSGEAAILLGVLVIPTGLFGCLFGGWVIKRFNLEFKGQIRFCLIVLLTSLFLTFAFLLTCPTVKFAGVTTNHDDGGPRKGPSDINTLCNADCACLDDYDPVCGSDDVLYYSPCHAGCTQHNGTGAEGKRVYSNCLCIITSQNTTNDDVISYGSATQGQCEDNSCIYKPMFFVIIAFVLALSFSITVPTITAVLQVVAPSQRSTAMGLQSLLYRGLGTVPGPIVFGALIDKSCILWETECDGSRTCWIYRNIDFAFYTFGIVVVCRILSLVFFSGSYLTYKPVEEVEVAKEVKDKP